MRGERQPGLRRTILKAARDLAPRRGSGIDSVSISVPGQPPVVLTPDDRDRLDQRLKEENRMAKKDKTKQMPLEPLSGPERTELLEGLKSSVERRREVEEMKAAASRDFKDQLTAIDKEIEELINRLDADSALREEGGR